LAEGLIAVRKLSPYAECSVRSSATLYSSRKAVLESFISLLEFFWLFFRCWKRVKLP